jgi:DNA mismatch repair protein MutS2
MAALKLFRVAYIMTKLAILVSQSAPHSSGFALQIDFFENVLVKVGDQQSILAGESTLMAHLNSFSSIIKSVIEECDSSTSNEPRFFLVLMDELGAGTDPTASGAIAQAVLEKLLESERCRIVATTHSP